MRRNKKDEYGFDPDTESAYQKSSEYGYADEYNETDNEDASPPVMKETADEYYGESGSNSDGKKNKKPVIIKQSTVKRLMFILIASLIAALSIVFAANNLDPLKSDFLVTGNLTPGSSSAPPSPSSSAETTTSSAETTTPAETTATPTGYTDSFPTLPNLDPDFAGEYAWKEVKSEEFLRLDNTKYLHAGKYWAEEENAQIYDIPGASYDKNTNTLTLNNYTGSIIEANLMGNGFKINLIGDNHVDYVLIWGAMYGGSVTFTGSGSITINENNKSDIGLFLQCEDSISCVMINREATVEIFGSFAAVVLHRTMLEKSIYTLQPIEMTGGEYSTGEYIYYNKYLKDEDGNFVLDEDYNLIIDGTYTVKEIAENKGIDLYDYSIVDDDGTPSKHVLFKPGE